MTIFKLLRLADALTVANAVLGFLAITYIADGNYARAELLILAAVLADGADGIVARRFGGGPPVLGDYLDIMADYLSFCVAPSILLYRVYFNIAPAPLLTAPEDLAIGAAAGMLVGLGLLRLARYVVQGGGAQGRFVGLPTTAAGLFTTLLVASGGVPDLAAALVVGLVALMMVTEVPYPKVRGRLAAASAAFVVAPLAAIGLLPTGDLLREAALLAGLAGASAYAASGASFAALRVPITDVHASEPAPGGESARSPPLQEPRS